MKLLLNLMHNYPPFTDLNDVSVNDNRFDDFIVCNGFCRGGYKENSINQTTYYPAGLPAYP